LIHHSRWHESLILRGSLLLKAWLGTIAREPGDIDWVFRPETTTLESPIAQELFDELIQQVSESPQVGNVTIVIDRLAIDDIWTYERAQGRRIVFPWVVDGLPSGSLQMDVVFGEELFIEPIQTFIPAIAGDPIPIWSVNPALSLAWKLLWLETDTYPQGKDLYDAVLLAEHTQLPFDLLQQVLQSSPAWQNGLARNPSFSWRSGFPWMMNPDDIDWNNFTLEYPWVEGKAIDWQTRLVQALVSTFSGSGEISD
jgi:hypothetical protein